MIEFFSLLSKYFLQAQEFSDIPTIEDEKQTVVDEDKINESLDPVNNALDGFREAGDWLIQSITDFFTQIFGNVI